MVVEAERAFSGTWIVVQVFVALIVATYLYYRNKFSYWSRRGVVGPQPWPIIGNTAQLFSNNRRQIAAAWRRKFGKVYGVYEGVKPVLMIGDPEVARQICIKNFQIFPNHDHEIATSNLQDQFLLFTRDHQWRQLRSLLSATFSGMRMRRMFKLLDVCADDLVLAFQDELAKRGTTQEEGAIVGLKEVFSLYTADAAASCLFGLKLSKLEAPSETDSARPSGNSFVRMAMGVFKFKTWRIVVLLLLSQRLLRLFNFRLTSETTLRPYVNRMRSMIERRQQAMQKQKFDDYLQTLLNARGSASSVQLDDTAVLSNSSYILVIALETTASILSHCVYALAFHQHVQRRLHWELSRIASKTECGFRFEEEALNSCLYLDAFLSETLRTMGSAIQIDRVSNQEYHIDKYGITLPAGSKIAVNVSDIMRDEDYWPEADKFEPDRFMPKNRDKIVPGSFCPFGLGPRNCLAMRFALTESRLALAKLVMQFQFSASPGTSYPPKLSFTGIMEPAVRVIRRAAHAA